MTEINYWLYKANADYFTGVDLYAKYGSSLTVLKLFKLNENSFNKKKLRNELLKIIEKKNNPAIVSNLQSKLPKTSKSINDYDPKIRPFRIEISDIYKTVINNREKLWSNDKNTREAAAKSIVKGMQKIKELWSIIDYFNATGHLIPELQINEDLNKMSKADLILLRNKNRSYISVSKRRLKENPEHKSKEKLNAEIRRREDENINIKKLLQ